MTVGFYAGSFDPFTNGHLEVVKKACQIFDVVIIGIGTHPSKSRRFNKDEMLKAIEQVMVREWLDEKVKVVMYSGLTTDCAAKFNTTHLVRGIRNGIDYQYEENIASVNQEISGLDTMYFRAGDLGNVSSSMVMELLNNGHDVSKYLPKEVLEVVNKTK